MLLRIKLIHVHDIHDVLTDLFLEGLTDKIISIAYISADNLNSTADIDSIKVEDFQPDTLVNGIEFKQIDSSPITAFKLGHIMSAYAHEVL